MRLPGLRLGKREAVARWYGQIHAANGRHETRLNYAADVVHDVADNVDDVAGGRRGGRSGCRVGDNVLESMRSNM
jgi:hypothetical protein